jgi:hypothetical protein
MTVKQKLKSRGRSCWQAVKSWLVNYGFATLVFLAIGGGAAIAWQTEVPESLPGLAFDSTLLYRVEVGGIVFLIQYLMILAFVLALNGRGFSEIGPKGVKAQKVVNRTQETIKGQEESIEALERNLEWGIEAVRFLSDEVRRLRKRLDDVEGGS